MKESKILGHLDSIETMGLVDGPGVRVVVFMQGCPLRCIFCHNPETWHINDNYTILTEGKSGRLYFVYSVILAIIVLYNHRSNIKRMLNGTENKLSFGKK